MEAIQKQFGQDLVFVPHQKVVGDTIADTGSFGQVNSLFHFVYDGVEDLKEKLLYIQHTYKVLDENNENMILNKLNVDEA